MGVYIKNMEMPTSCWLCHFQDCGNCVLNNHKVVDNCIIEDRRDEDCPIVPVPPHGDLIDRSKLYEKTAEWEAQALHMVETTMNDEDASEWRKWSTVLTERSAFKFDVADAPTIIPASGGN